MEPRCRPAPPRARTRRPLRDALPRRHPPHAGGGRLTPVRSTADFFVANRATLLVASGLGGAALVNYGYHVIAGRVLGPGDYGAFAALLGIFTVLTGLSVVLQNLVATQVAAHGPSAPVMRAGHRLGLAAGVGLFALLLVASPFLVPLLRLDGVLPLALVGLAGAAVFAQAVEVGGLQGAGRSRHLSANYLWAAGSRFFVGIALLLLGVGVPAAVVGLAAGAVGAAVAARLALRRTNGDAFTKWVVSPLAYSIAFTLLLAFTNLDLVVARWALPEDTAGAYAFAAAIGRLVLFLAVPIVVATFPRLVRGDVEARRHARILALLAGGGLLVGLFLFRGLLVTVMGDSYAPSAPLLPWYALAVIPYALLNIEIVRAAATRPAATGLALAAVLALELGLFAVRHGSPEEILQVLGACGVVALAAVAAVERWAPGREPAPPQPLPGVQEPG